ncbi:hypothetical protein MNBD_GAMMA15-1319 [hydrothermal vent metagenome]|uniref:Sulfotransferase domain-containing protein n=1 Tax=hydrothermal vent metagenome TaxID=652676 RepID=A0A3B0ZDR1_9ZZZZ
MTNSQMAVEGGVTLQKIRRSKLRLNRIRREFRKEASCLERIYGRGKTDDIAVTAPVALISQIQRSGGTLLSQLFDGHPEIHAHPQELKIGYPKKYIWPRLDLSEAPRRWFELLFEDDVIEAASEGYRKDHKSEQRFPFDFSASLQRKFFLEHIRCAGQITMRDVYNAYFSAYFRAWRNNINYLGDKKYITAFTPRLAATDVDAGYFFDVYPDGRLISVVRDPKNWFPSACLHTTKKNKYADFDTALDQWLENTQAMMRNKENYGGRVCIVRFEDLIDKTGAVMEYLSDYLGIEFLNFLLTPTFNGSPITANTSFNTGNSGIIKSASMRYKTLGMDEMRRIERKTGDVYGQVLEKVAGYC